MFWYQNLWKQKICNLLYVCVKHTLKLTSVLAIRAHALNIYPSEVETPYIYNSQIIASTKKKWTRNFTRLFTISKWFYSFHCKCWGYHIIIIAVSYCCHQHHLSFVVLKKLLLSTFCILVHFKMADINSN